MAHGPSAADAAMWRIRRLLLLAAEVCENLCLKKAAMPARLTTLKHALRNTEKSLSRSGDGRPAGQRLYMLEVSLQAVLEVLHRLACIGELSESNEELFRLLSVALVMDVKEKFDEHTTAVFESLVQLGVLRSVGVYFKKRQEDDEKDVQDVMTTLLHLETNDNLRLDDSLGEAAADLNELLKEIKRARSKLSRNVMAIPAAFVEQISGQVIAFAQSASRYIGIPRPANWDMLERSEEPAPKPYRRATWMDQVSVMEFRYAFAKSSSDVEGEVAEETNGAMVRSELYYWLKRYNHGRHIMKLYDYFLTPTDASHVAPSLCLLVESCETSLYDLLYENSSKKYVRDDAAVDYISFGILQGLQFLHGNGFAHGRLTSEAVFLGGEARSVVKLGGFLGESMFHSGKSQNYLAPEVLSGSIQRSFQADAYSFGMVMFEMVEGTVPFTDIKPDYLCDLVCNEALRPSFTTSDTLPVWIPSLLRSCWANNPWQRPSIKDIVQILNLHSSYRKDHQSADGSFHTKNFALKKPQQGHGPGKAEASSSPTPIPLPEGLSKLAKLPTAGNRVSVRTSACIGSLLTRLSHEWRNEAGAAQLLSLLKNNCLHKPEEEIRQAFHEHRIIHTLALALERHGTHETIQADTCFLLGKNFQVGAGTAEDAIQAAPPVAHSAAAFLESPEVFTRAVFALRHMDPAAVAAQKEALAPLLLEGAKEYSHDDQLCRDSLLVFADCVLQGDVPWTDVAELVEDAATAGSSLQVAVLATLTRLTGGSSSHAKQLLRSKQLIHQTLELMEAGQADEPVQEASVALLRQLAATRSSSLLSLRAVASRLLNAMVNYPSNAGIQEDACGALCHLASLSLAYESLLVRSSALDLTQRALDTFPERPRVAEQALRAIAQMSQAPDDEQRLALAKRCAQAQQRMLKHRFVAAAAMEAVHALCQEQTAELPVSRALLAEGYLEVVMTTLSKYGYAASVQAEGFGCLQDLTLLEDISCNLQVVAANCVAAVVSGMRQLKDFEAVTISGLACLTKFSFACAESTQLKRQLKETQALASVTQVLREHRGKRRVVRPALWAVWAMLRHEVCSMAELAELQGVALVERCCKKFAEVDSINMAVFCILYTMCEKFPNKRKGLGQYRFNKVAMKVLQRKNVSDEATAAVFRYLRCLVKEDTNLGETLLKLSGNGAVLWRRLLAAKAKPTVLEPGLYLLGSLTFSAAIFDANAEVLTGVTKLLHGAIVQHQKSENIVMAVLYCLKRLLMLRSSKVDKAVIKAKLVRETIKALKQHQNPVYMIQAVTAVFHSDINPVFIHAVLPSYLTVAKHSGGEDSLKLLSRVLLEGESSVLKQSEAVTLRKVIHSLYKRIGNGGAQISTKSISTKLLVLAWHTFEDPSGIEPDEEVALICSNMEQSQEEDLLEDTWNLVAHVAKGREGVADRLIEKGAVDMIVTFLAKNDVASAGAALCVLAAACSANNKQAFLRDDTKPTLVKSRASCDLDDEVKQEVDGLIRSSRTWLDVFMRK